MQEYDRRLIQRELFAQQAAGEASTWTWAENAAKTVSEEPAGAISGPGKEKRMPYRTLGRTRIRMPVVNMGVRNATDADLVKRSYELGIRYFDAASGSRAGQNEAIIGKAIQELGVRDKVIIGTGVCIPHEQRPWMSPARLQKVFLDTAGESLRRMRTEFIDIFYVHDAQDLEYMNNSGIMEALWILKESGKIRYLGCSLKASTVESILDAVRSGFYEVLILPYNYAMADDLSLRAALEHAQTKGIGLIAMETQCMQYWDRENVPGENPPYYGGTISQTAVLKWALRPEFITCALPGYTTLEQMEELVSIASDLEYTAAERRFLEDRTVKTALMRYCRQCGSCRSTCPNGVDIPALMRTHLYAVGYASYEKARETIRGISSDEGLTACSSCDACSARCHRRVPVERRLHELRKIYG